MSQSKQHILDEIKRTATANGHAPLGIARFFSETGIKESDWKGKYWARWNDAVREAGFSPNKPQGRYDEILLIEKIIGLIRKLDRFPTTPDIRLAIRADRDFPNDKTLYGRYGGKAGLVKRIFDHCNSRDDLRDVISKCEAVMNVRPLSEEAALDDSLIGYVYLIGSGRYYKVGKTNALGRREYELSIQLPERVTTVHAIKTDDPTGIEAYWHKRFEPKRKNGEWFDLNAVDIAIFRKRKFM